MLWQFQSNNKGTQPSPIWFIDRYLEKVKSSSILTLTITITIGTHKVTTWLAHSGTLFTEDTSLSLGRMDTHAFWHSQVTPALKENMLPLWKAKLCVGTKVKGTRPAKGGVKVWKLTQAGIIKNVRMWSW